MPDVRSKIRILISQAEPERVVSPYRALEKRYEVEVSFFPFIRVQPVPVDVFSSYRLDLKSYTALVFTSGNAIDYFFYFLDACGMELPQGTRYFCVSEQASLRLQKHLLVRKRKVHFGQGSVESMFPILSAHPREKYLFPCSNIRRDELPNFFQREGFSYREVVLYETKANDLSGIAQLDYDVLVFFSPSGVDALFSNFPAFEQGHKKLAVFGTTTADSLRKRGFEPDIEAPSPNAPSMVGALELYVRNTIGQAPD